MKTVDTTLLSKLIAMRPDTPEGKSGPVELAYTWHPAGKPIEIVSMRNAIFMGQQACSFRAKEPFLIRELSEEGVGVWMRDSPQEIWQMATAYQNAHGRVLCGGLGLGVLPHLLAKATAVRYVVAIERNPHITKLVADHIDAEVWTEDIRSVLELRGVKAEFDFAVFDTWQMTSESVWWQEVVPLRRLARGKIKEVLCWAEDEMCGQLRMGLPKHAVAGDSLQHGKPFMYEEVFRRACRAAGVKPTWELDELRGDPAKAFEVHSAGTENPTVMALLDLYLKPSHPRWERVFGELWDALVVPPEKDNGDDDTEAEAPLPQTDKNVVGGGATARARKPQG